ncbi:MAG: D-alanine--D-alanine ligase [Candidatus Endonucleobacter bathymodioli]|uniref:D-alanine--D-alanine ligase n=1 Tax=Candidatus Endonucleibacter bathymodioli TaxID=539814 RepID=A0AA90NL90_9GAMM|nr:D-alanine--D-alanine ligase [Candidatus Endonucleobacter bathymodioli]
MSDKDIFSHRDAKDFGRVAVLCGGRSAERKVSLASGENIYEALQMRGIECQLIDAEDNLVEKLLSYRPDRAFIALHGAGGEDGAIHGLLEYMSIPYPGSDVLSSALAMDKYRAKLLWQSVGLPTPAFQVINSAEDLKHCVELLPVFVKPSREGSSVGIVRVDREQDLENAWNQANHYRGPVLVEQYIDGAEFTVGILNDKALPVIRVDVDGVFYDYDAKYLSKNTGYIIPCGLSVGQEQEIQALALIAFETLGCSGWGRVDVMQDSRGRFWLLEVNTIPGMTDHSLVPMAAKEMGLNFDELVVEILWTARSSAFFDGPSVMFCAE